MVMMMMVAIRMGANYTYSNVLYQFFFFFNLLKFNNERKKINMRLRETLNVVSFSSAGILLSLDVWCFGR